MTGTADPSDVRRDEDVNLRRFVAARKIGDQGAMRMHWNALLTDNFDRVVGLVYLEADGRLDHHEREEAVQGTFMRLTRRVIHNFRGTSMGEWVNAVKTVVHWACIDVQDAAKRVSGKERSLDTIRIDKDGEERSPWGKELYAEAESRRAAEEEAIEDAEEREEHRAFLAGALPQLSEKLRAVAERDLADMPVEQMMEELGLKRDAIYQRRRRYILELEELRKRYPS